jgi:hypothetical protein
MSSFWRALFGDDDSSDDSGSDEEMEMDAEAGPGLAVCV